MKTKLLFVAIAVVGSLFAGCGRDDDLNSNNEENSGNGTIKVAIKGESVSESRSIGNPTQIQEDTVKSFTVYVFNYLTGAFERVETFTGALTGEITDLNAASTKRVVVLVNFPTTPPIPPALNNYTDLQNLMVDIDSQVPGNFSTIGLFMSGEYSSAVTLNPSAITYITVPVSRLVAKIRLGSLTVTPDAPFLLTNFTLETVTIQKARDHAHVLGGLAGSGDFSYVGGIAGSVSLIAKSFLYEAYALPPAYVSGTALKPQIYFYVLPNDNTNNNATILSLRGTYLNSSGTPVTMYYSIRVNDEVGSGTSTTDGNWVERNKIYTLNVTLKKLGLGGGDPDVPNQPAILDVGVEVADWEAELIQAIEW